MIERLRVTGQTSQPQEQLPRELLRPAARVGPATYYGFPALKRPGWGREVVLYFYLGGLAAGSYLLATLSDLFGAEGDRAVGRTGRYLALITTILCPLLLIADLGRPERFANMLRIIKTRSPMNMGTWGLIGFGISVGLAALRQAVADGYIRSESLLARILGWVPFRASGVLGSLFAFFVSGYTGTLLSFTNVPLWARNYLFLAPTFITSALSSGIAAVSLLLTLQGGAHWRPLAWMNRTGNAVAIGEAALTASSLAMLGLLARPLLRPRHGLPFWLGAVGLGQVAPLLLRNRARLGPKVTRKRYAIAADLSVLAGGLLFRWVTLEAGKSSSDDARAYFTFARGRRWGQ
ncbi:MAG: NrfD/PsrC family molybdoenzyme membrane anchor subunit [Sphingomonadaceae bacterium]